MVDSSFQFASSSFSGIQCNPVESTIPDGDKRTHPRCTTQPPSHCIIHDAWELHVCNNGEFDSRLRQLSARYTLQKTARLKRDTKEKTLHVEGDRNVGQ